VGTGPYKVQTVSYASNGLPNQYTLVANKKFALGEPYITHIILKSYQTEKDLVDAYKSGDISSMYGISGNDAKILKLSHIILSPLPRVFGVFFNQNLAPVLVNKEVRQALNTATNKQAIVDNILGGYGQVLNSPIPENTSTVASTTNNSDLILKAQNILTKAGWTKNLDGIFQKKDKKNNVTTLSFSISTGDAPELKETAYLIQKEWQAMGANVSVKIFETSDLNQNIIRPRKYDALLFGEVVGRNTDLYPFWHSSQRQSPGLNIALYANVKADKILENLRKNSDPSLYNQLNKEIINDVPAVFTYSPYFIYVLPNSVHGVNLGTLNTPSDRLSDIYRWYIEINNVWKIFLNKK
jgi:peptide/nickel transport system substrate-binding protein